MQSDPAQLLSLLSDSAFVSTEDIKMWTGADIPKNVSGRIAWSLVVKLTPESQGRWRLTNRSEPCDEVSQLWFEIQSPLPFSFSAIRHITILAERSVIWKLPGEAIPAYWHATRSPEESVVCENLFARGIIALGIPPLPVLLAYCTNIDVVFTLAEDVMGGVDRVSALKPLNVRAYAYQHFWTSSFRQSLTGVSERAAVPWHDSRWVLIPPQMRNPEYLIIKATQLKCVMLPPHITLFEATNLMTTHHPTSLDIVSEVMDSLPLVLLCLVVEYAEEWSRVDLELNEVSCSAPLHIISHASPSSCPSFVLCLLRTELRVNGFAGLSRHFDDPDVVTFEADQTKTKTIECMRQASADLLWTQHHVRADELERIQGPRDGHMYFRHPATNIVLRRSCFGSEEELAQAPYELVH